MAVRTPPPPPFTTPPPPAIPTLQADLVPLNDEYAAMMAEAQAQQRQ